MDAKVILTSNEDIFGHAASLRHMFDGADDIKIAVAFFKKRGAEFILTMLADRIAVGATVELFVGTDFFHTDPWALEELWKLTMENAGCTAFVAARAAATFHPKIYSVRKGNVFHSLVGSANLTGGALGKNEELSLCVTHAADDELTKRLEATFDRYRCWDRLQPLETLLLQQYSAAHAVDKRERAKYEKARDAALPSAFDLGTIARWHKHYLASAKAMSDLASRKKSRGKALRLQRKIAALNEGPITQKAREALRAGLGDLIGSAGGDHLWGSSNITRQGSQAKDHEKEMIRFFALAQSVAHDPVGEGYAKIRKAGEQIPGVGINMATEMLCTYAPTRYAVYNGNTVGALATLGIEIAKYPQFHAISPSKYEKICDTIKALGTRIRAADLSDADAFLNWVYSEVKEGRQPPKTV